MWWESSEFNLKRTVKNDIVRYGKVIATAVNQHVVDVNAIDLHTIRVLFKKLLQYS